MKIDKLLLCQVLVVASTLVQLGISYPIWTDIDRHFPSVNFIASQDWEFSSGIILGLSSAFVGLWLLSFHKKYGLNAFLLSLLPLSLLIAEDAIRLQPWIFSNCLFLFVCLQKKEDFKWSQLAWILACTYFWSGVQKFNFAYCSEIFPWLIGGISLSLKGFFLENPYGSLVSAALEALFGILLLFPRTQKATAFACIGMHLFIIACLGPWGNAWNYVVIPWNLLLIGLVYLVFVRPRAQAPQLKLQMLSQHKLNIALLCIVGIMPLLNFFRMWDMHLSFSLYSGNNPRSYYYYHIDEKGIFPALDESIVFNDEENKQGVISLYQWCFIENSVPAYPEKRHWQAIGRKLCDQLKNKEKGILEVTEREKFTSKELEQTFSCEELR